MTLGPECAADMGFRGYIRKPAGMLLHQSISSVEFSSSAQHKNRVASFAGEEKLDSILTDPKEDNQASRDRVKAALTTRSRFSDGGRDSTESF